MRHSQSEFHKQRLVDAIMINVVERTITKIKIKNNIDYLQKILDFYNFYVEDLSGFGDSLIVSNDKDSLNKNSFSVKGDSFKYHGSAVVVRRPKSNNYQKLMSTKMSIEDVKNLICFTENKN